MILTSVVVRCDGCGRHRVGPAEFSGHVTPARAERERERLEAAAAAYRAAVMELRAVNEAHATRRGYSWARHEAAVRAKAEAQHALCEAAMEEAA